MKASSYIILLVLKKTDSSNMNCTQNTKKKRSYNSLIDTSHVEDTSRLQNLIPITGNEGLPKCNVCLLVRCISVSP